MAKRQEIDRVLFTTVILLVGFGMVVVYSAAAAFAVAGSTGVLQNPVVMRQFGAVPLGLGLLFAAAGIDYRRWREPRVVYGLLGLTLALLTAVLFTGPVAGVHRWLILGPFQFQPSELAKPALVVFLAYRIERYADPTAAAAWRGYHDRASLVIPTVIVTAMLLGLVLLGSDLGATALLGLTAITLLFLAGLPWRYFVTSLAMALPMLGLVVISEPYRRERLFLFLDPERDPMGTGFQATQSLIAVGSGGLWGAGLGRSSQKFFFLPRPHSDFIYSIVGEELGLLGALLVLALYLVLLWRGLRAGQRAPDLFGRFLAWGLTAMVALQAFLNLSVVLALLPVTSIPLPLVSAGGSSLVVTLAACGILLNVSRHA